MCVLGMAGGGTARMSILLAVYDASAAELKRRLRPLRLKGMRGHAVGHGGREHVPFEGLKPRK